MPHIMNGVLYIPGRGSFLLDGNEIADYTLYDIQLESFWGDGWGHPSRPWYQRVTFHDGSSYLFRNSSLIYMRDRFGNMIGVESVWNPSWGNKILSISSGIANLGWNTIINFSYNIDYNGNRTITITGPDRVNFTINGRNGTRVGVHYVTSVRNQLGEVTTFTYDWARFTYTFQTCCCWWWELRQGTNYMLLLSQVRHPSGAILRFDYGIRYHVPHSRGGRSQHVVTQRALYESSNSIGNSIQRTTFSYQRLPNRTTVTQNNGLRTVYTFDNRNLLLSQQTYNISNVLLSRKTIAYNSDRLPITIIQTEHSGGRSRTTTQEFVYNRYGQITTAVSPLALGSTHERYRTIITYDPRFGLPLTTTFMPDAQTTIREVNVLSNDGRSIIETRIYQNNILMSRTTFQHDNFGNITEIREFPVAAGTASILTQITYDRGTRPSSIRVFNESNILVAERQFTYDTMWRITSETDPMGYTTHWQYDRLGRVTRVTHPNGAFETYTYNDQQNILTHRTVLGATYTYRFDPFGNLLTITAPGNTVILTNTYDNRMRLIETRNAQGIASSQRTTFAYDIFDRVTGIFQLNAAGATMHHQSITYHDIFNAALDRRIVTRTIGGTERTEKRQKYKHLVFLCDLCASCESINVLEITRFGLHAFAVAVKEAEASTMSKKEKLIRRIKGKPKDFTYDDAEALLLALGFIKPKAGKTGGSRVKFLYKNAPLVIHKPHPRKELLPYQINDILEFLEGKELI